MSDKPIFISYSRKDSDMMEMLSKQLQVFNKTLRMTPVDDRDIGPGARWKPEIHRMINEAAAAVLLLSPDYFLSKVIQEKEQPEILLREKRGTMEVFPIVVRACPWDEVPELNRFNALPRGATPIKEMEARKREGAMHEVATAIKDKLKPRKRRKPSPTGAQRAETIVQYLVNRHAQEKEFAKLVLDRAEAESDSHIACVIHGDQCERPDLFFKCVTKHYLRRILRLPEELPDPKVIDVLWPTHAVGTEDIAAHLRDDIRTRHSPKELPLAAKLDAIALEINKATRGPLVIRTDLYTSEWPLEDSARVRDFFRFWQDWPVKTKEHPLVVCLVVHYPNNENPGFFKRILPGPKRPIKNAAVGALNGLDFTTFEWAIGGVVPELESVKLADARRWAEMKEVQRLCGEEDLIRRIERIFGDAKALPMDEIAHKLKTRIIDRLS